MSRTENPDARKLFTEQQGIGGTIFTDPAGNFLDLATLAALGVNVLPQPPQGRQPYQNVQYPANTTPQQVPPSPLQSALLSAGQAVGNIRPPDINYSPPPTGEAAATYPEVALPNAGLPPGSESVVDAFQYGANQAGDYLGDPYASGGLLDDLYYGVLNAVNFPIGGNVTFRTGPSAVTRLMQAVWPDWLTPPSERAGQAGQEATPSTPLGPPGSGVYAPGQSSVSGGPTAEQPDVFAPRTDILAHLGPRPQVPTVDTSQFNNPAAGISAEALAGGPPPVPDEISKLSKAADFFGALAAGSGAVDPRGSGGFSRVLASAGGAGAAAARQIRQEEKADKKEFEKESRQFQASREAADLQLQQITDEYERAMKQFEFQQDQFAFQEELAAREERTPRITRDPQTGITYTTYVDEKGDVVQKRDIDPADWVAGNMRLSLIYGGRGGRSGSSKGWDLFGDKVDVELFNQYPGLQETMYDMLTTPTESGLPISSQLLLQSAEQLNQIRPGLALQNPDLFEQMVMHNATQQFIQFGLTRHFQEKGGR